MTRADEFRAYAREALAWSSSAKNDGDKQAFLYLADTWVQAAGHRDHIDQLTLGVHP